MKMVSFARIQFLFLRLFISTCFDKGNFCVVLEFMDIKKT